MVGKKRIFAWFYLQPITTRMLWFIVSWWSLAWCIWCTEVSNEVLEYQYQCHRSTGNGSGFIIFTCYWALLVIRSNFSLSFFHIRLEGSVWVDLASRYPIGYFVLVLMCYNLGCGRTNMNLWISEYESVPQLFQSILYIITAILWASQPAVVYFNIGGFPHQWIWLLPLLLWCEWANSAARRGSSSAALAV